MRPVSIWHNYRQNIFRTQINCLFFLIRAQFIKFVEAEPGMTPTSNKCVTCSSFFVIMAKSLSWCVTERSIGILLYGALMITVLSSPNGASQCSHDSCYWYCVLSCRPSPANIPQTQAGSKTKDWLKSLRVVTISMATAVPVKYKCMKRHVG